jgi:hypothetical protein
MDVALSGHVGAAGRPFSSYGRVSARQQHPSEPKPSEPKPSEPKPSGPKPGGPERAHLSRAAVHLTWWG